MKKTSASIFLALFLDFIFSLLFFFFIFSFQKNKEETTYYMNQIGIFEEIENTQKSIHKLEEKGLSGYTYSNDDLYHVVTSITLDKNTCINEQKILDENQISYIQKEITTSNQLLIQAIQDKKYEKVMELMSK